MKLFASCYRFFAPRRGWLLLVLPGLGLLSGWQLVNLQMEENISALLPDGHSQVARDFQLLQQAPFARKLVINLRAEKTVSTAQLLAATDRLRDALPPDLFVDALSGPGEQAGARLLNQLGSYLPLLLDTDDLAKLEKKLTPQAVDHQLQIALTQLMQPQGVALKQKIRRDPLNLELLALQKLRYLNPVPDVRLEQGHFLSRDRRNSLILADTPIAITDSQGSKQLLEAFAQARQQLPRGITAELVSGHVYTLANATIIQQDISRLLIASGIGILLLFVVFLRSWRALFVYLLPLFSFAVALLVVAGSYTRVSGITVGFGAVLLGITIDFGLHVYFTLRKEAASRELILQAVSRPVIFGALTSLVAFAVLLGSELPGQRQLALFAMAGILAAVLMALFFLPHFIGHCELNSQNIRRGFKRHIYDRMPLLRKAVLFVWLLVVVLAVTQVPRLSINGNLRQLSYQSESLHQNEMDLSQAWGNMRGRALIFVQGENLQSALQRNEQVWRVLKAEKLPGLVSLAPLFPAQKTQQQRLEKWQKFWSQRQESVKSLLTTRGQHYGFTTGAFDPFWKQVTNPPETFGLAELKQLGLGDLLDNLLLVEKEGYQLISLLPDRPELMADLQRKLAEIPGVVLVSQARFGQQLGAEIEADFKRFILLAAGAVFLLVILLFRRPASVLLAILPVVTGLLVMFGGMAWLGLDLNLFNVVASILIIGLGVDYGIFMVCHTQQQEDMDSSRAILVSGLTTLVGFGALVLARHPALHSIGLTVLLGISAAVPTAVLVIPALVPKRL